MVSAGSQLLQIRGGSATFDPLTGRLAWFCRFDECPGRRPVRMIAARLWKGHFTMEWLFCWLWWIRNIFEKARLPVGTAGFESATP